MVLAKIVYKHDQITSYNLDFPTDFRLQFHISFFH